MRLRRVEIYGFKSFAQRTELSFDKGITGIVGPNGSGKSNIADAVRWVLGEQSAKTLRGSKMEDVIFNGTQTRKALPYCEVSLQFDNEDHALNSPYAEVLVTRRAYRNGEGEYFLNRSNCRLRDILELFRDTGIGKEGYSIIGQGRIEEILSNRGEDRRGVFEEAAGIVSFRVRKEEAERKLQRTQENLLRVGDLLEELSSRLGPLEAQAKTAQEYLSLSERLRSLEVNVYLRRHERLNERLRSLEALGQGLADAVALHEDSRHALSQQRQALDEQLSQQSVGAQSKRSAHDEAQSQMYASQSALQAELSRIESLESSLQGLQERTEQEQASLKELSALLEDDASAREGLEKQVSEAQAAVEAQEAAHTACQQAAEGAEQQLDAHRQVIIAAMSRLSDIRSQQARQQAMLQQMEARRTELERDQATAQAERERRQQDLERAGQTYAEVEQALAVLEDDLTRALEALKAAEARQADKAEALRALTAKHQSARSRLQVLEEMARSYEGYGQAVRRALQHAAADPRVHGALAKLIKVPAEYETAIDMILGGSLQHIVTQDEETAKELINYLREQRLGRTTFLPITAIRPRTLSAQERQLLDAKGCIGIASELVSCDPRHRGILENLLGRTVIVESLDDAIPLSRKARQAFTVVTLAGDVMRAGGAMTGGTVQSKVTSLLGREREIGELRLEIDSVAQALHAAEQELEAQREAHEALRRDQEEAAEALSQERIALARETERRQNASQALAQVVKRQQELEAACEQLDQAAQEIRADLEGAARQSQGADIDQQAMEAQTLLLQKVLSEARQQAQAAQQELMRLQSKQTEASHQLDLLTRDRQRLQREAQGLEASIDRGVAQQERQQLAIAQARAAQAKLEQDVQVATRAYQEQRQAMMQSEAEREALQQRQRALADESEALHARQAMDNEKLHKNELVRSKTLSELQALDDYLFNSYDLTYALAEPYRLEGRFELPKAEIEVKEIKQTIRDMGTVNVAALEDYALTKERHAQLALQQGDAERAKQDLESLIVQLQQQMAEQFVSEFAKLNGFFAETFKRLFGGGKAELILTDPKAPLSCDIDVAAQPPGKRLQLLSLLSGGERALTAIAILFAMLKLKPTPFCILDEIEAALDEANIGLFADYLSEYAKTTQFIVITHRKGTMERCDALYGVTMQEKGVSGMVSVDLMQYAV